MSSRPRRAATIAANVARQAAKVVTISNRNTLLNFKSKLNSGEKLTSTEQTERAELLNKLATAGENTAPYVKKKNIKATRTTGTRRAPTVSDANVRKSYYLLSIALGNMSGIPTDPNQRARLVNAARKFRLATKPQLASWAGSFLETTGFNTGAKRASGVEVEDGKQKNKPNGGVPYGNPKWLIYKNGNSSQPRTAPTIFLKTAFDMDLIKSPNSIAKSRTVMGNNLSNKMTNLVQFTETLINTPNNTGNNANAVLAGKTKGTTQIQPDIILVIPSSHEIHIYELKIGAGKKETIPAESIQLAKMKYIIDVHLGGENPKWKVIPHFLPWRFGQLNNSLNFKNWEKTQLKGVKKIANAFVAWAAASPRERGSYSIVRSSKTNKPLENYLNIGTVNSVLNSSHIGRMGEAATGAGVIVAESLKKQIENQMGAGSVASYLKLAGTNKRIPSTGVIQRALLHDLKKQTAFYFANIANQNIIPNYFKNQGLANPISSAVSEVSRYARNTPGGTSRDVLQARLARSVSIADAFVQGSVKPSDELMKLVVSVKQLLAGGGLAVSNNKYNINTRNILNKIRENSQLVPEKVYAEFLNKFGNSAKNMASKAILQTLASNQSLNNKARNRSRFLLENFNNGINRARGRALRTVVRLR